jgi:hypothetical protein
MKPPEPAADENDPVALSRLARRDAFARGRAAIIGAATAFGVRVAP